MSIQYINEDFVLEIQDNSDETLSIDTEPSKYYVNTGASMSSPFTFTEIIINPTTCAISIRQNDQVLI